MATFYDVTATYTNKDDEFGEPLPSLHGVDLSVYDKPALYSLLLDIEAMLPTEDLRDISVEHELVRHLRASQALQTSVIASGAPANQKAQIVNSVASILTGLAKLQMDIYTSERLKDIEAALLKALRKLPIEEQAEFLAFYEKLLKKEGRKVVEGGAPEVEGDVGGGAGGGVAPAPKKPRKPTKKRAETPEEALIRMSNGGKK